MKKRIHIIIIVTFIGILFSACISEPESKNTTVMKPTINEKSLGLRKTDIYNEGDTKASKTEYTAAAPGTSHKFKRAFQDAPPMIPHSLDGLLPIKANNNQCLGCHMPDMAKLVGSTPIPRSHFTNFRPLTEISKDGKILKSGVAINNTSSESQRHISIVNQGSLVGARFNCTQCHAPQSQGNVIVENSFEAEYTSEDGTSRSSWKGTKLLEGIDTRKSGF